MRKQSNIVIVKPDRYNQPKLRTKFELYRWSTKPSLRALRVKTNRTKCCVIVASGPSIDEAHLTEIVGHERIKTMQVNHPYKPIWPTDYWFFVDNGCIQTHKRLWAHYEGQIICGDAVRERRGEHDLKVKITKTAGPGFSEDLTKGIILGLTSSYAALQVACWMDYKSIYFFGVDMCAVDNKLYANNWVNPVHKKHKGRIEHFRRESTAWSWAGKHLPACIKNKIYLCSNYNKFKFVDNFQSLDHTIAYKTILEEFGDKE